MRGLDGLQRVVLVVVDREVLRDPHDLEDLQDERLDVAQAQLAALNFKPTLLRARRVVAGTRENFAF